MTTTRMAGGLLGKPAAEAKVAGLTLLKGIDKL